MVGGKWFTKVGLSKSQIANYKLLQDLGIGVNFTDKGNGTIEMEGVWTL